MGRLTWKSVILAGALLAAGCSESTPDDAERRPPPPTPSPDVAPALDAPSSRNDDVRISIPRREVPDPAEAEPIQPIPPVEAFFEELEIDFDAALVELGRQLFHDPRLSADLTISCATCHDLRFAGIDRTRTAVGFSSRVGKINTPTVFNAAYGVSQFWDGRAESLEEQAIEPAASPMEMGASWNEIVARLRADARIVEQFREAFPDEIDSPEDLDSSYVAAAIADFERTLITPDSAFDRFLLGDRDAITDEEFAGYVLFKELGCKECHYGPAVGGKTYQRLGRTRPYFVAPEVGTVHLGRFNVTQDERDRFVFKVPMLRNVEVTAPYFHDGHVATLEEAVLLMGAHQLGKDLSEREVDLLVAFLCSLTGEYRGLSLMQQWEPDQGGH